MGLDKRALEKDTKDLAHDLKRGVQPVVDVWQAAKDAAGALKGAIGTLSGEVRKWVALANEQERVERRLIRALELKGQYNAQEFKALQAANSIRQQATGIGDELQLQIQGTAIALGVEARSLNAVTEAAIGLSEVTGKDLEGSLRSVIKLYNGSTAELKKLGIQGESAQQIFDSLREKMALTSETVKTVGGQMKLLEANTGDFMEELGNLIVKNEDVKALFEDLNGFVLELTEHLKESGPELSRMISDFVAELRLFGTWLKDHRDDLLLFGEVLGLVLGGKMAFRGAKWAKGAVSMLGGLASKVGITSLAGAAAGLALGTAAAMPFAVGAVTDTGVHPNMLARGIEAGIPGGRPLERPPVGAGWSGSSGSSEWLNSNFGAGDLDVEEFEIGSSITSKKGDRAAQQAAAEKARKAREKALQEELDELARKREASFQEWQQLESLRAQELEAQEAFNAQQAVLAGERISTLDEARLKETEVANKRNAALIKANWELHHSEEEIQAMREQSTAQFYEHLTVTGGSAIANFTATLTQGLIEGEAQVGKILLGMFGMMLSTAGQYMSAMGTAALVAATSTTATPWLWPIFGGPIGIGGAVALIAGGGVLMGIGQAMGGVGRGSSGGGGGGGRSSATPRPPMPDSPGVGSGRIGGNPRDFGRLRGGDRVVSVVNVSIDGSQGMVLDTTDGLARRISELLDSRASFRF